MPADAGALKTFMYDWLTVLGGFDIVPYDIRSCAAGASLAEARFVVRKLYVVDWRPLDGEPHRSPASTLGALSTQARTFGPVGALNSGQGGVRARRVELAGHLR